MADDVDMDVDSAPPPPSRDPSPEPEGPPSSAGTRSASAEATLQNGGDAVLGDRGGEEAEDVGGGEDDEEDEEDDEEDEDDDDEDEDGEGRASVGVADADETAAPVHDADSHQPAIPIEGQPPTARPSPFPASPRPLTPLPATSPAAAAAASSSSSAPPAPPPPPSAAAPTSKPTSKKPAGAPRKPSRSASPPAPPPPPALTTVRLRIALGGPERYAVDIAQLLRETGQRPATPPPSQVVDAGDGSEDEGKDGEAEGDGEGADGASGDGVEKKKKKKKKNLTSEYYDLTDPFIDDSELAVDQRTYFAQTKQQGFYVSSGEVALLKDKTPARKPKSKKPLTDAVNASLTASKGLPLPLGLPLPPSAAHVTHAHTHPNPHRAHSPPTHVKEEHAPRPGSAGPGTRDAPIPLLSDGEDGGSLAGGTAAEGRGAKRKRGAETGAKDGVGGAAPSAGDGAGAGAVAAGKKRKVDIQDFSPELRATLDELKAAIARESWEVKGKFPPAIKPVLAQVALRAVRTGEYDERFFALMPSMFPYNRFTMTKLIKRTVFPDHTRILMESQEELLADLARLAADGFPKAQEEYEKSVAQWEKRQEKAKAETGDAGGGGTPGATPAPPSFTGPVVGLAADDGDDGGGGANGGPAGPGRESHPPQKKYRLTDQMRVLIWRIVALSNECCKLENEKNQLEGSTVQVSEQGLRKQLYQKIVAAFPDGWMSSGQISREVSSMKKRLEKEAMEMENDG